MCYMYIICIYKIIHIYPAHAGTGETLVSVKTVHPINLKKFNNKNKSIIVKNVKPKKRLVPKHLKIGA